MTSHTEHFTLAGPLPGALVAILACGLIGLFLWSLRRERDVLGPRLTALFAVLRMTALAIAFWMLLAPATVRTEKSRTPKSVAIVVDISPSMLTLDPPAEAEDVRWTLAAGEHQSPNATILADQALAAVWLAESRLATATSTLRAQQPERRALESAAAAHDALERVRQNMHTLVDQLGPLGPASSRGTLRAQAAQIERVLEGPDFAQLAKLAGGVHRGHDSFQSGWREGLVDLQHQLTKVQRHLREITQQVATDRELAGAGVDASAIAAVRKSSRLARVAELVDAMEASALAPRRKDVDIRHASFDSTWTPLPADGNPGTALRELAQRASGRGAATVPGNPPPTTNLTAVLEELRKVRQEQPLAATFIFTDAAHNQADARDPRTIAAHLSGSPVYVVPIGNTQHVRDVDLAAISAPGVVMKDDEVVIEATLRVFDCEGETVHVELLRDGQTIQQRDLSIDTRIATPRARFNTQLGEVGVQRFQLRVVPLAGEVSDENNFGQCEVNVTRDHISLLLADELPRWEYRYLAQLFRRDGKVECDELLFHPRMIATGRRAESPAFPRTPDEWGQYDVVLLGDVSSQNLPIESQQSLAAFVRERGGTLILIAGEDSMPEAYTNQPLEDLLPVRKGERASRAAPEGFTFRVTDEGWQHHALMIADTQDATRMAWDFINRNSPLFQLSAYRYAQPTARTLISATPRAAVDGADDAPAALLSWQPLGRGRVVFLGSPETYRLRFLRGDRLHYRFWGQLLRWAIATDLSTGTQLVSIRTDRPDYNPRDPVEVVVRLVDESGNAVANAELEAVASAADRAPVAIPLQADPSDPGRYVGSFNRLASGVYRVEPRGAEVSRLQAIVAAQANDDVAANASFTVHMPRNPELLDTRSDRALAQQIAEATGGQVLPPTAVSAILALTNLDPIVTESTEILPLWVQWKYLWIVFGCLFGEWVVRKQLGMS